MFNNNFFLQQQLLLQQMIIYNQMLYQRTNSLPKLQQIIKKNVDENDLSSQQILKQDETNPVNQISKQTRKFQKTMKIKAPQCVEKVSKQIKETSQKKKIFLSMLDIKEAQYKKFKIIEEDNQKKPMGVVQEQL
ncbi:unnamed protein product [Paramecium pentaurelia]|uniref:Uncharacterized protein n=1 Tax=Paramecium pentaurelia TaxID=43138 RepID=A0A8S1SKD0_9CILI|nr:unnamed protein product [Paramecium pentaurelia]